MKNIVKTRNKDILASFRREVNLRTKVVRVRTKFSRKTKHKGRETYY